MQNALLERRTSVRQIDGVIGAEVDCGIVQLLDEATFAALHRACLDHLVVLIRGQSLSIPDLLAFGRRFGDLPLILNGVIDPQTTAHGPNESLHLGVFEKAIVANVYLYDELAAVSELVRA
jgi:hypothetical protein